MGTHQQQKRWASRPLDSRSTARLHGQPSHKARLEAVRRAIQLVAAAYPSRQPPSHGHLNRCSPLRQPVAMWILWRLKYTKFAMLWKHNVEVNLPYKLYIILPSYEWIWWTSYRIIHSCHAHHLLNIKLMATLLKSIFAMAINITNAYGSNINLVCQKNWW